MSLCEKSFVETGTVRVWALTPHGIRLEKKTIDIPVLHIAATKDEALPPSMSKAMDRYIPQLTRKSVDTHHWALWEKPDEVNHIIHGWLESVIPRRASHL